MFDYDGDGVMNEAIKFGDKNQLFWGSTGNSTGLIYNYSGRILEVIEFDDFDFMGGGIFTLNKKNNQ